MAKIKDSYKIPYTINVKRGLDDPVAIKSGNLGLSAPVPVKVIMMFALSVVLYVVVLTFMLTRNFGLISIIMFTIGYFVLARLMLKKDRTGERGFKWVKPTLLYFPSYRRRKISTRSTADKGEVEQLNDVIPIEDIDTEKGFAYYTNGDIGIALDVIGNGSRSLFDKEKENIITAFDQFLRELELDVYFIVDMKEGKQNCQLQIDNLEAKRLENTNPTADMILKRRIESLKGIEQNFKTTEYTLFLRANDSMKLDSTLKVLKQKQQMGLFKYLRVIYNEELYETYREFYSME